MLGLKQRLPERHALLLRWLGAAATCTQEYPHKDATCDHFSFYHLPAYAAHERQRNPKETRLTFVANVN